MTTGPFAKGLAALSVTGVAVLGFQVPTAVAQPGPPAFTCPNPGGQYPPGQCRRTISDETPQRGQSVTVTSGSGAFTPGSNVEVRVLGVVLTVQADATGNATATFRIPDSAPAGRTEAVLSGVLNGAAARVAIPFTVPAAAAAAPQRQTRGSALPRTGADHVAELTAAGLGLVLVGGGVVFAARRRRDEVTPTSLA